MSMSMSGGLQYMLQHHVPDVGSEQTWPAATFESHAVLSSGISSLKASSKFVMDTSVVLLLQQMTCQGMQLQAWYTTQSHKGKSKLQL